MSACPLCGVDEDLRRAAEMAAPVLRFQSDAIAMALHTLDQGLTILVDEGHMLSRDELLKAIRWARDAVRGTFKEPRP